MGLQEERKRRNRHNAGIRGNSRPARSVLTIGLVRLLKWHHPWAPGFDWIFFWESITAGSEEDTNEQRRTVTYLNQLPRCRMPEQNSKGLVVQKDPKCNTSVPTEIGLHCEMNQRSYFTGPWLRAQKHIIFILSLNNIIIWGKRTDTTELTTPIEKGLQCSDPMRETATR